MSIDRRTFLKGVAGAAAGAGAASVLPVVNPPPAAAARDYDVPASLPVDRVVRTPHVPPRNRRAGASECRFYRRARHGRK